MNVAETTASVRSGRPGKVLAVVLLLLGLIAVAELSVRLFYSADGVGRTLRRVGGPNSRVREHPIWRFELVPDERGVASVNAMGFRGPEIAASLPAKVRRIIFVGGSTTYGVQLGDDETYPRQLAQILASSHPGEYDVINAGVPATDLTYHLRKARPLYRPLAPAVVGLNTGWNELSTHILGCSTRALHLQPESRLARLLFRSHIVRYAITWARQAKLERGVRKLASSPSLREDLAPVVARAGERIRAFAEEFVGTGTNFVLVPQPSILSGRSLEAIAANEGLPRGFRDRWAALPQRQALLVVYQEEFTRMLLALAAERADMFIADCTSACAEGSDEDRRARFIDAIHLSGVGNALLAECLARHILELR